MKKIVSVLFFIIILSFLAWLQLNSSEKKLEIYFLDIGQGDAILIRTPEGKNILIDGGPDNLLLYRLGEFLPWWERKIDYLVISHYHADHMLGLIELLDKYQVNNVLVSAHQPEGDFLFDLWQKKLLAKNVKPQIVKAGEKFLFTDDLFFQVLSADFNHEDYNDNSVVIKLTYQQIDLLLTGDFTSVEEEDLLKSSFDLASEILKVGHHGSKYSSSAEFLVRVQPELCLIQLGQDNSFGHPHPELLERLAEIHCQVFRNDLLGTIKVVSDGSTWQIK